MANSSTNGKYLAMYSAGIRLALSHLNACWAMKSGNLTDALTHVDKAVVALQEVRKSLMYFKNSEAPIEGQSQDLL